ncbi:MAG TPA: SGNH/GDSL hydrolase family protein [Ilumatobacteraceae bacterium]
MKRSPAVALGACAALVFASAASAFSVGVGPAAATLPATRGTIAQLTPTNPPPVPRVLLIGDSSLEGIKFYSHALDAFGGMSYVLDAESCRRLVRASCHSLAGNTPNTALEAIESAPGSFDAVVIGTGYNEGSNGFGQNFDLIVAAARAKGAVRILWMNYRLRDGLTRAGTDNNGSYIANNATLDAKVASGAYADVFVANWRDYTASVRSWFVTDGIHYQPVGALGSADYISRWITHLFLEPCPKPTTVGGTVASPCTSPDGQPPPDVRALYG